MRTARRQPCFPHARLGLTVVEVLVALVIVSVGLLGMAGTSALSLRTATATARERRAVRRLELRLAALGAAGCGRARSGTADDAGDGVRERWMVSSAAQGAALLDATAEWRSAGGWRTMTLRSALLC